MRIPNHQPTTIVNHHSKELGQSHPTLPAFCLSASICRIPLPSSLSPSTNLVCIIASPRLLSWLSRRNLGISPRRILGLSTCSLRAPSQQFACFAVLLSLKVQV